MTIVLMYLQSSLLAMTATTYGLGILCLVLFFIAPSWIGSGQSRTLLLVVGASLMSGGSFYWWAFHTGEQFAIRKMAAREAAIVQQVQDAQRQVDACNGGVDWDVTTGSCSSR